MSTLPSTELVNSLLSIIPSLPRTVLNRLVTNMVDHIGEMDGGPDLEGDEREPAWCLSPHAGLRLPGTRSRSGQRVSRLHCRQALQRYRPRRPNWRKGARH